MASMPPACFTLVLLGNSHVGKTHILSKLIGTDVNASSEERCHEFRPHTITLTVDANKEVQLKLFDTPGMQKHLQHSMWYCLKANPSAVVLVFSKTDAKSLRDLPLWLQRAKKQLLQVNNDCKFFVIGIDCDQTGGGINSIKFRINRGRVSNQQWKDFWKIHQEQLIDFFFIQEIEEQSVRSVFCQIAKLLMTGCAPDSSLKVASGPTSSRGDAAAVQPGASARFPAMLHRYLSRSKKSATAEEEEEESDSWKSFINEPDAVGTTLLMLAAAEDRVDTVDDLAKKGAKVDQTDTLMFTALTHAVVHGRSKVVGKLLEEEATPHQVDFCQNTPLIWAARGGHLQVIKELQKSLKELHQWQHAGEYGMTASQWAQHFGRTECCQLIDKSISRLRVDSGPDHHEAGQLNDLMLLEPAVQARGVWYEMNRPRRGFAMIVNNIDFPSGSNLDQRRGAAQDFSKERASLYQAFAKMGFTPRYHENKGRAFFQNLMEENCPLADYSDHDAFLLCLSSHGCLGGIYGSDGTLLRLEEDIFSQVRKVPGLRGKPKIFLVQACRNSATNQQVQQQPSFEASIKGCHEDCYYVYSVVKGGKAMRDVNTGCLFAQALRDVLLEDADLRTDEFTHLMPEVVSRVANITQNHQIVTSTSTLRRLLYFPPLPGCLSLEVS